MSKFIQWIMLTAFVSFVTACTTPPKSESMGEYIDSAAITTKVKANLVNSLGSHGLSVQVKTFKDEVLLSGFVDNDYVKKRAGVIASNTAGVRQVRNALIVK